MGEKALRQIIENAYRLADRCLPQDANHIRRLADDIGRLTNALCDLRQDGKGQSAQAESLSREIRSKLADLEQSALNAVIGVDKAGHQQTAHTVTNQQYNWL